MKRVITSSLMLIAVLLMSFNTAENLNEISIKSIEGTWNYSAPEAPYEYQEGELIFSKKDGKLTGYAKIEGSKIEFNNVVLKNNKVSFYISVDGDKVSLNLNFTKNSFKGTASSYNGELEILGKKKK